jgi:hypothetical protein
MDNIIEPTLDYNFDKLQLGTPISQPNSSYLTRIFLNSKPLYLQTPKCLTKNGIVNVGKKTYCDLMFSNDDSIFVSWIENLENKCQELILSKSDHWFETPLSKDDINIAFSSPLKIYKSGKYYLMRVNVKPNIKIYNDADINTDILLKPEQTNIISILEIQGIKFTSRNFQIEIELKQSMIVSPDPFLDNCFIKKSVFRNNSLEKEGNATNISEIVNNILKSGNAPSSTSSPPPIIEDEFNIATKEVVEEKEQIAPEIHVGKSELEMVHPEITEATKEKEIDLGEKEPLEFLDIGRNDELSEVQLTFNLADSLETITLKKPNEVYYKLYRETKQRAKKIKMEAKLAYIEANKIKEKYMLEIDSDDTDSDNYSNFSDSEPLEK